MSKKDNGIARLPNGILIPEELRDALQRRDFTKAPEAKGFNPDTATTADLKYHGFSGFRVNQFTQDVELWVLGQIRGKRKLADVQRRPETLADLHEEVFLTKGTVIETQILTNGGGNAKTRH